MTILHTETSASPLGCRDPALAAYEAEEVLQRGSLAFVSNLASSVASGVLGIARAAVVGRQSGFRAGTIGLRQQLYCCHVQAVHALSAAWSAEMHGLLIKETVL